MSALNIHLFGKFGVYVKEQPLEGLDACKVQELLGYLLVHRERPHTRESLASLLWGDTSTDKSKKYLRQTLWHLQSALDGQVNGDDEASACAAAEQGGLLSAAHDWVRLNQNSAVWLDVEVFERAFALVQGRAGQDLDAESKRIVQEAAELYKGDLLEGWYQDWCLYERERLQNMYLVMLDKLICYSEAHRDYESGLLYGSIILRYDRARERTHRQLMHLHYMSGDRTAALRQYERCVAALNDELDVVPDRRTANLYQQIRLDQLDEQQHAPAHTHTPQANAANAETHTPVSLPEVLGRLQQLQRVMSDVQQRIQQDIKAVQQALKH